MKVVFVQFFLSMNCTGINVPGKHIANLHAGVCLIGMFDHPSNQGTGIIPFDKAD